MVRNLHSQSLCAAPTAFHHFLENLAATGKLTRHYTQNIDYIEDQLAHLNPIPGSTERQAAKTVQLHGRLKSMVCQQCRHHIPLEPELFQGSHVPSCPACENREMTRRGEGERARGIGRLRPQITLYGEDGQDNDEAESIGRMISHNLRQPIGAVLVVGTTLKVPGVREIVVDFCQAARARTKSATISVSKERPPASLESTFDVILLGDCDDVIPLL